MRGLNLDQPFSRPTPNRNTTMKSSSIGGNDVRNPNIFEILDDDYFDAPILSCALPEQGTFSLSIQPILNLGGIPAKTRSELVKTNLALHFATILGAAIVSAVLIASMGGVLIAVSYEDCTSLTKDIVSNQCYFLLIFLFAFTIIRMGIIKTYVIQPTVGIFKIIGSTPRELFTLTSTGILWAGFVGIIQSLDGTLHRGHYTLAVALTMCAILVLFFSLFSFGDHARSYLFRQGVPNLEVPEAKTMELPLFISGCGMQHLCDSITDGNLKQLIVSLDQWMEYSQQIMNNVLIMFLVLNIYGLLFYMLGWSGCKSTEHEIHDIVYVEGLFVPLVLLCFACVRVYVMKSLAARPVAKRFNLKKKAGISWILMILCFFGWGGLMYLVYYFHHEQKEILSIIMSIAASVVGGGGISFFYSQHVSSLVRKVKVTIEHTTSSRI